MLLRSTSEVLLLLFSVLPSLQGSSHHPHFHSHPIYRQLLKKAMPKPEKGPLAVYVGFYIESLGNFRSTEMAFDMDVYLYLSWKDERMKHNETDYVLINDKNILDKMWLPDLYFANARTAYFHEVTVHNFNMFIARDGTISYGTRVTLNLACHLDLQNYPLDSQTCLVKIISYAHVIPEMNATWMPIDPIRYNPEITLPEYFILKIKPSYCNGVFHYTITPNSSRIGEFSCLQGMLHLKRAIGYHLVQSFIPTALIVAISWVSFWIDRRAVPARISLSFTTLLTLSTQGNGIRYGLPPVSYAKAIDYFYGVCMLFIFGVLLEFALVNSYMRRANKYNQMAEKLQAGNKGLSDFDSDYEGSYTTRFYGYSSKSVAHLVYKALMFSRKALYIDQTSRLAFPLTFLIFNISYWLYYLKEPDEVF